jgi:hypothetical protein
MRFTVNAPRTLSVEQAVNAIGPNIGFAWNRCEAEWTLPSSPKLRTRCAAHRGAATCVKDRPEMKFEGRIEGREMARRPTRIDVYYDAIVQCGEAEIAAQILNLSAQGFRLRSHFALREGEEVLLVVPKLPPVRAAVRWVKDHEAGGVLLDPVAL